MDDWKNRIVGYGTKKASEFQAHPHNWRKHPARQRSAVRGSLDSLGWVDVVIENTVTGRVVDGHERIWQALSKDDAEVPYIQVELTEAEEAQALLSLDAIAAMAEADRDQIDALLREVKTDNADVMQFLTDLAAENKLDWGQPEQGDAEPQIYRAAELLEKWQVKTGDLWRIGEHKLLCGDSTKREDVERLMGGEKAGAVVTDPPYGINREGIENDDPEGLRELFDGCLSVMPIENAVVIAFQSPRLFPVWLDALRDAGQKFERALWMHKINDITNAWHKWMLNGEIIILSSVGKVEWGNTGAVQDCYVITHDVKAKIPHTSVKPLPVFENVIEHTTGMVHDPFAGSGTTLVACQNLGRKGRGIEISPAYCAVTLERMATAFPGIEIARIDGTPQ